jgi:hypothetical protein
MRTSREIPEGTVVSDSAIVTDEESLQQVFTGNPVKKTEFTGTDRKTHLLALVSHGEIAGGRARTGRSRLGPYRGIIPAESFYAGDVG